MTIGDPNIVERNIDTFINTFSASKYFNISAVALHWYVWHQVAWQTNYPNYFPAKNGFSEASQRLQQKGASNLSKFSFNNYIL